MLFAPKEKGQGLVEYALILVLVAVVVMSLSARPSYWQYIQQYLGSPNCEEFGQISTCQSDIGTVESNTAYSSGYGWVLVHP
jgi:hypothetical protein